METIICLGVLAASAVMYFSARKLKREIDEQVATHVLEWSAMKADMSAQEARLLRLQERTITEVHREAYERARALVDVVRKEREQAMFDSIHEDIDQPARRASDQLPSVPLDLRGVGE